VYRSGYGYGYGYGYGWVQGDPQSQDPVVYDNGVSYMFIQHSNVYLMAASRQNCNAASLISFLHRVVDVIPSFIYYYPFHAVSYLLNYNFYLDFFLTSRFLSIILKN
jgi:hypothetical protein